MRRGVLLLVLLSLGMAFGGTLAPATAAVDAGAVVDAGRAGTQRVIVTLRARHANESGLGLRARAEQRAAIASGTEAVDGIMTTAAYHAGSVYLASNQWTDLIDFHDPGNTSIAYALDANTGAIRWQRPLPSPAFGALTYANGVVFQPTVGGTVYALDAATGAILWSKAPGGDLGGGVSVVDGRVFVPYGFWFFAAPPNPNGGLVAYALP